MTATAGEVAAAGIAPAAVARTCVIASLPRSGSWLLANALEATGLAGRPQEYLRPTVRRHYAARFGVDAAAPAREFLAAALRAGLGADGTAGIKIHWQDMARTLAELRAEGLRGTDHEVAAAVLPDPRYIHLVRRDVLAQAVSWCRALDSDTWWEIEGRDPAEAARPWDPDWDKLEVLHGLLGHHDQAWRRFFAAGGIVPLEVAYEELVEDQAGTVRRCLEHLGVAAAAVPTIGPQAMRRQADATSRRWAAGARHLDRVRAASAPTRSRAPRRAPSPATSPQRGLPPTPSRGAGLRTMPTTTTPALETVLAQRRWVTRSDPFPHVVARDVFTEAFAAELEAAFTGILDRGLEAGASGFSRNIPGYDAFGHTFRADVPWPMSLFISREWHDLLCAVAGVRGSGQVFCGLHHHLPGSGSGSVHNDLNPGWFPGEAGPGEVVISDARRVVYSTGDPLDPTATPAGAVRAIAMLYFLKNPGWRPGDGGEMGLYTSTSDPIDRPAVAVPPIDNSLVLFECTPHSFHGFIHNRRTPRSSLIMWVHRPRPEVEAQWGRRAIVEWPRSRPPRAGG